MQVPLYLDYNATTPVDPQVLEKMLPYFYEQFGNAASSTHAYGWSAEKAVDKAREQIAEVLGCSAQELIFTSGATEGINLALKGVADLYASKGDHIITAQTEHKAVLDACKALEREGKRITYLPVDKQGLVDPVQVAAAIEEKTILVCLMLANNETGVIQPLKEIAEIVHTRGVILMSDAVQAAGKIPLNIDDYGIDLMPISAHKFYGPKGVGVLYLRRRNPRVRVRAQIDGGGHERGMRSGTLNVPSIVGMGEALHLANANIPAETERLRSMRDELEKRLLQIPETYINGGQAPRLSHVTNIRFEGINNDKLMMAMPKLAVSAGSACTSAKIEPSHVLAAMGLSEAEAYASIRISLGRFTQKEHLPVIIDQIGKAVDKLRDHTAVH